MSSLNGVGSRKDAATQVAKDLDVIAQTNRECYPLAPGIGNISAANEPADISVTSLVDSDSVDMKGPSRPATRDVGERFSKAR